MARFPRLGHLLFRVLRPILRCYVAVNGMLASDSSCAVACCSSLHRRIQEEGTLFLVGFSGGVHDTGACVLWASKDSGPRILVNYEEDRIWGKRGQAGVPEASILLAKSFLVGEGGCGELLTASISTYDYCRLLAKGISDSLAETPQSVLLMKDPLMRNDMVMMLRGLHLGDQFQKIWGAKGRVPVLGMPHHDAHAWLSYGASPFASGSKDTMIVAIDATGDCGAISLYRGRGEQVENLYSNDSFWDSLGFYYSAMSAAIGGWPMGSSEGRCMGAAAWGDMDRSSNRYYSPLKEIFLLEEGGKLFLNRRLANWQRAGFWEPFTSELKAIIGAAIQPRNYWDPEYALDFERGMRTVGVQDRVDKIAAVQLVFEDAVFHIVEGFIRDLKTDQLVMTGGSALNCMVNGKLLERYDAKFFKDEIGIKSEGLQLWVPPFPGDAGAQIGAAYAFAVKCGSGLGDPLPHPFYSGRGPAADEVQDAAIGVQGIQLRELGRLEEEAEGIGDLAAFLIQRGVVLGLFQGAGELGLRALGHRSILADPFSEGTQDYLNRYVKKREMFRPFGPMLTAEAAEEYFVIPPGVRAHNYDALRYMNIAVRAKAGTKELLPAVCNCDGTSRIQVVPETQDPISYSILKAMGRRMGAEVVLNTSLNVETPIAGTVKQGLETVKRSGGRIALLIVSNEGRKFLAWDSRWKEVTRAQQPFEELLGAWGGWV